MFKSKTSECEAMAYLDRKIMLGTGIYLERLVIREMLARLCMGIGHFKFNCFDLYDFEATLSVPEIKF